MYVLKLLLENKTTFLTFTDLSDGVVAVTLVTLTPEAVGQVNAAAIQAKVRVYRTLIDVCNARIICYIHHQRKYIPYSKVKNSFLIQHFYFYVSNCLPSELFTSICYLQNILMKPYYVWSLIEQVLKSNMVRSPV